MTETLEIIIFVPRHSIFSNYPIALRNCPSSSYVEPTQCWFTMDPILLEQNKVIKCISVLAQNITLIENSHEWVQGVKYRVHRLRFQRPTKFNMEKNSLAIRNANGSRNRLWFHYVTLHRNWTKWKKNRISIQRKNERILQIKKTSWLPKVCEMYAKKKISWDSNGWWKENGESLT